MAILMLGTGDHLGNVSLAEFGHKANKLAHILWGNRLSDKGSARFLQEAAYIRTRRIAGNEGDTRYQIRMAKFYGSKLRRTIHFPHAQIARRNNDLFASGARSSEPIRGPELRAVGSFERHYCPTATKAGNAPLLLMLSLAPSSSVTVKVTV